jgi:8-oxo-dGTP diphosphatase
MVTAQVIEAAGGVVERQSPRGTLIAIVRRERYGQEWVLPKGKRGTGEPWQTNALREVKEETGLDARIIAPGGCTFYSAGATPKIVMYWRMVIDGEPPEFVPNDETKELKWLAPIDAALALTHAEDVRLLQTIYSECDPKSQITWVERWFRTPIYKSLRGRVVDRLSSDIEAYEIELANRARISPELAVGLPLLMKGLVRAKYAARSFKADEGWKFFRAVQRSELLYLDAGDLRAVASAMKSEAVKLNQWRKLAVVDLLGNTKAAELKADAVFRAAALRDEHYHNEAYKDVLRRQTILMLAFFLVATLAAVVSMGASLWPTLNENLTDTSPEFIKLLCLIGLLGSVVSAITDLAQPQSSARIPEMAATLRVTLLRLFIGPASALALFFAAKASLGFQITGGYSMLVLAFAGGFSERLVLRVVQSITASGRS